MSRLRIMLNAHRVEIARSARAASGGAAEVQGRDLQLRLLLISRQSVQ